jgi:hypothetical protein
MFDERDVDSRSGEQGAREDSNEFGNLAHLIQPTNLFLMQ